MALSLGIRTGLARSPNGSIVRRHFVFAKDSRPEVASQFIAEKLAIRIKKESRLLRSRRGNES